MRTHMTQARYLPGSHSFENIEGVSQTVPGESMTIKQLLDRYKDMALVPKRLKAYLDTEDIDQVDDSYKSSFDLTEVAELGAKTAALQKQAETQYKDIKKKEEQLAYEKAKAELEAKIRKEIEEKK